MKRIESLKRLSRIKKSQHHPLIHKIHRRHNISRKTLFYVKEYGPHTNVPKTIIKESIKILLFASIISSFGGLALEHIKTVFISILPLVILLPTLNDMIGDYGSIISSRFSTMLHEKKITKKWWINEDLKKLFYQILIIAVITTILSSLIALVVSSFSDYSINKIIVSKIFFISILDVILLVTILFLTAILAGLYFYKKNEDPNNFLIPITTSIADFGNMFILTILILLFF
jgi:cation transporter-like permease